MVKSDVNLSWWHLWKWGFGPVTLKWLYLRLEFEKLTPYARVCLHDVCQVTHDNGQIFHVDKCPYLGVAFALPETFVPIVVSSLPHAPHSEQEHLIWVTMPPSLSLSSLPHHKLQKALPEQLSWQCVPSYSVPNTHHKPKIGVNMH